MKVRPQQPLEKTEEGECPQERVSFLVKQEGEGNEISLDF